MRQFFYSAVQREGDWKLRGSWSDNLQRRAHQRGGIPDLHGSGSVDRLSDMICVTRCDLRGIAESEISRFDKAVAEIPAASCSLFHEEASRLEAGLLGVYRVVTAMVRQEEDMDRVAECWGAMVGVCDQYAERLAAFHSEHPDCGAVFFYDRILDLRNKCERLCELHS